MRGRAPLAPVLAALATLATAAPALAQGCTTVPAPAGRLAILASGGIGSYDLADDVSGLDLGGDIAYNAGAVALAGGFVLRDMADTDHDLQLLRGRVGLRLPDLPFVGRICLWTGPAASILSDDAIQTDYTNLTAPVGIGLGGDIDLGPGLTLSPYIAPAAYFATTSATVLGLDTSASQIGFGGEAGLILVASRIVAHAAVQANQLDEILGAGAYPNRSVRLSVGFTP